MRVAQLPRASTPAGGNTQEKSEAASRVAQALLALKKRVLEIEELLTTPGENGVDTGAASRKQKGLWPFPFKLPAVSDAE